MSCTAKAKLMNFLVFRLRGLYKATNALSWIQLSQLKTALLCCSSCLQYRPTNPLLKEGVVRLLLIFFRQSQLAKVKHLMILS